MAEVTMKFMARQLERLLDSHAAIRDDLTVLLGRIDHVQKVVTARLEIVDETLKLVQAELRALRGRDDRLGRRIERLEAEAKA
jgi:polyhydroxyalkanoate synthesis regulator phasin